MKRTTTTKRTDVAVSDIVQSPKADVNSAMPDKGEEDNLLKHGWHIREGTNGVNYASEYPAPVPYSYSDEPEAVLAVESRKIPRKPPSLKGVVDTEIRNLREGVQIEPYL
jgi:hypothetical protein